jgi:hypothetical protein
MAAEKIIGGALLGLGLAGALGYCAKNSFEAQSTFMDTKSGVERTVDGITLDEPGSHLWDAYVHLRNRNLDGVLRTADSWDPHYEGPLSGSTTLQDTRIAGSKYRHGTEIVDFVADTADYWGLDGFANFIRRSKK